MDLWAGLADGGVEKCGCLLDTFDVGYAVDQDLPCSIVRLENTKEQTT